MYTDLNKGMATACTQSRMLLPGNLDDAVVRLHLAVSGRHRMAAQEPLQLFEWNKPDVPSQVR